MALWFSSHEEARRVAEMEVTIGAKRVRMTWGGVSPLQHSTATHFIMYDIIDLSKCDRMTTQAGKHSNATSH